MLEKQTFCLSIVSKLVCYTSVAVTPSMEYSLYVFWNTVQSSMFIGSVTLWVIWYPLKQKNTVALTHAMGSFETDGHVTISGLSYRYVDYIIVVLYC